MVKIDLVVVTNVYGIEYCGRSCASKVSSPTDLEIMTFWSFAVDAADIQESRCITRLQRKVVHGRYLIADERVQES